MARSKAKRRAMWRFLATTLCLAFWAVLGSILTGLSVQEIMLS